MKELQQNEPVWREVKVQLFAMTYFYGIILAFLSQILVLAAGGFAAFGVSMVRGDNFENYFMWANSAFEFIAIYPLSKILRKSFSGIPGRIENLKSIVAATGRNPLFVNERLLAVIFIGTGLVAVAWLTLVAYNVSEGAIHGKLPVLIVWTVLASSGSVFMGCYIAARAWLYREVRADSIIGLLTMLLGLWLGTRNL